jgi:hypothetical protein
VEDMLVVVIMAAEIPKGIARIMVVEEMILANYVAR